MPTRILPKQRSGYTLIPSYCSESALNLLKRFTVTIGTGENREPCTHNLLPGRRTVAQPLSPSVELSETANH